MSSPSPDSPARNPRIDALRGLSVLLVVLFHLKIRYPLHETALGARLPRRVIDALQDHGFDAVTIFFVISGFLITRHTLRRHGSLRDLDLRAFYVRRAARILPFLLLLVAVLSALHGLGVPDFTISGEGQTLGRAVLAALFLHINLYEAQTGYLPGSWDVLWSLSIEEVFYLGFPLVCVTLRRPWLLGGGFLALGLALPELRNDLRGMWMSKAYLPGMACIAMGVTAAMVSGAVTLHAWAARALRWLGGLGIASVLLAPDLLWPLLGHGLVLLLTTSTGLFLLGSDQGPRLAPISGLGWLRRVGQLSYEIYLTHMFLVLPAAALWKAVGLGATNAYLLYPTVAVASVALGHVCAHGFTNPVDRALRARWLGPRTVPS